MKHRYLYVNPRGFRNDFDVYQVPEDKVPLAEQWMHDVTHCKYTNDNYDDVRWITRREAERLLRRERANARDLLAAGQNLYQNPVGAMEFSVWESPRVEDL